jgi:hypothetical protein
MIAASMTLLLLLVVAGIVAAVLVFLLGKRQAQGGGFSAPIKWTLALMGLARWDVSLETAKRCRRRDDPTKRSRVRNLVARRSVLKKGAELLDDQLPKRVASLARGSAIRKRPDSK